MHKKEQQKLKSNKNTTEAGLKEIQRVRIHASLQDPWAVSVLLAMYTEHIVGAQETPEWNS